MSASVTSRVAGGVRARAAALGRAMPWLVDAYRVARTPRRELAVARDLRATRRQCAAVRQLPRPAAEVPAVLVALYRDDVFDAKAGCSLATALRLQGLRPVVSVPSARMRRALRYAAAFGIDDVVVQEELGLDAASERELDDAVVRLLAGEHDFDTIKGWRFREWGPGTHVLSSVIRLTFDGSPDLAENAGLLAAVTRDVLTNYLRAEQVVHRLHLRAVLVEEANYSVNGPLVDVATARGVDVIQTIPTWRDDALMSKRLTSANRRVDAKSVAPETLDALMHVPWAEEDDAELDADFARRYGGAWQQGRQFQPGTQARSRDEIVAELGLDPTKPTAVIFAHVLWDASLFFGVDLFENYADWFVQTIGAAVANDRVNWIVKAHPSNVFRTAHGDIAGECSEILLMEEHYPCLPDHVHLLRPETEISTLSLYRATDFGVTVRGTPGMEMACFSKPVFTAGTGTYAGLGFTIDSSSVDEYLGRLARIDEQPPLSPEQVTRARRYAHTLFTRRPWVPRSFSMSFDFPEQGWHPLDRNVTWNLRNSAALAAQCDLDRWSAWVLNSREDDYLEAESVGAVDAGL